MLAVAPHTISPAASYDRTIRFADPHVTVMARGSTSKAASGAEKTRATSVASGSG
jgi:hypothetical protein